VPGRPAVSVRAARPEEAASLGLLALRSKANWGYPPDFIEACREELSYSAAQVASPDWAFEVAEADGAVAGFYALERICGSELELVALFVEPARIGQGVGRLLMDRARQRAVQLGATVMAIQSDPYAAGFYQAAGAELAGERESGSIPGRFLPMFTLRLDRDEAADALPGIP